MRVLLLLLTSAVCLSAAAQQPAEPAEEPQVQQPAPEPENPRTKLGHPLDPADVATLTGRPQSNFGWTAGDYGRPAVVIDLGPQAGYRGNWLRAPRPLGVDLWFWDHSVVFIGGKHHRLKRHLPRLFRQTSAHGACSLFTC